MDRAALRANIVTHTFVYITAPDTGKLVKTYSWGNDYGDNQNHWFSSDDDVAKGDVGAADDDIRRRAGKSETKPTNIVEFLKVLPDEVLKRGVLVYGDDYNEAVAEAFKLLQDDPNSGSGHKWGAITGPFGLPLTCKEEAGKLLSLAKIVKEQGVEKARQWLADHWWWGYGWRKKGDDW